MKNRFDLCRRYGAGFVQRLKREADMIKEGFDAIIDHLKVARVEYDPCWIAVFEKSFLLKNEWALCQFVLFNRKRWILPVCVFGKASTKRTSRGYLKGAIVTFT